MSYFIIQTTDFTGKYKLATSNNTTADIQAMIDRWEKFYLYQLLGQTLGDLFVADCTTHVPVTARFLAFYNAFNLQDGVIMRSSQGLKDYLLACIFYEYVFDVQSQSTQAGVGTTNVDTADQSDAARYAERRFNDALSTYDAIRKYIGNGFTNNNVSVGGYATYPEYVEVKKMQGRWSAAL